MQTDDDRPPLRRLADHLVKGGLDDFVKERRATGRSWRLIERDLYLSTKGKASVSFETLRSWYPDLAADTESVA